MIDIDDDMMSSVLTNYLAETDELLCALHANNAQEKAFSKI